MSSPKTIQAHITGAVADEHGEVHVMDTSIDGGYVLAFSGTEYDDEIETQIVSFGTTNMPMLCSVLDRLVEVYGEKAVAEAWAAVTEHTAEIRTGGMEDGFH